jgi:hypothetical protein
MGDRQVDPALVGLRVAADDAFVGLPHHALLELRGEPSLGLPVERHEHEARGVAVEAVDDERRRKELLDPPGEAVAEGGPAARHGEQARRLDDYLTGRDSYEFHKWRIDNRNSPTFQRDLKERYDRELRAPGIAGTERLMTQESQSLYENVIKNLKRRELLADWWEAGSVPPPGGP